MLLLQMSKSHMYCATPLSLNLVIIVQVLVLMHSSRALPSQPDNSFSVVSDADDQNDGPTAHSQPKSVHDLLLSIDERLRLLEAYENTYKLNRIDFTLEQLNQRIVAIESKITRLEVSLDIKAAKTEEMIDSSDRRTEFRTESLSRKVQHLTDRTEAKSLELSTKLETKSDHMSNKLNSIEAYMRLNCGEVTDKLAKQEERRAVFESHVKSHIMNIESLVKHSLDANTNIKEIVTKDFQQVDQLIKEVKEAKQSQISVTTRLSTIATQIQTSLLQNSTAGQVWPKDYPTADIDANWLSADTNETIPNPNSRSIAEQKNDFYQNISTALEELKRLDVDRKLTQLDVHIDYFSRKILNTIQEILRSSQASENYLREALDTANKSRSLIRNEFTRIQESIGPLIKENDFTDIREVLEQKLNQLSSTIDDSFNALLITQNSFITSCNRIQEEEEQLYDILDDMLLEIRNKTNVDVLQTNQLITELAETVNRSMARFDKQFESIDRHIAEIRTNTVSNASNQYSATDDHCFLTRNQLISVCNKHKNSNSEAIDDRPADERPEPNYEDMPQTE